MIRDEDLKTQIDYTKGQKQAAYNILGEIVNLLNEYADDILLIGGWVPSLLFEGKEHIGSIDVDLLLNQVKIENTDKYENIRKILIKSGYVKSPNHYFKYVKTVEIQGQQYDVDVDFLCGKYGGKDGKESKHVDGIKALKTSGGNFAFEVPSKDIRIEYERTDGAKDFSHINVVSIVPYFVLKTNALGRGKAKDAYDIYFCISNYNGSIDDLVNEFLPYKEHALIKDMCKKLSEKFYSINHAGPNDIVNFLSENNEEERARIKQDAYQKINYLINKLQ